MHTYNSLNIIHFSYQFFLPVVDKMFLNPHPRPKCWSCWIKTLVIISVETIVIIHLNRQSHHLGTFAVELPNNFTFRRFPLTVTEVVRHQWQWSCLLCHWMSQAVTDTSMTDLYCRANDFLLITTRPLLLSPCDLLAANCQIWAIFLTGKCC